MRIHTILLAACLSIAALTSSVFADIPDSAFRAALFGPEQKKVKIQDPQDKKNHEFNIKPVTYRRDAGGLIVFGQLSHHLSLQDDDQLWYCIVKPTGQAATSRLIKIKKSRMRQMFGYLDDLQKIPIGDPRWKTALEVLGQLSDVVNRGSGWERAAESFYQQLAQRVSSLPLGSGAPRVELYQHNTQRGKKVTLQQGQNVAHLKKYGLNDEVSSVFAVVPAGYTLELFKDDNYRGKKLTLGPGTHAIRDLKIHDLGDELTSVRWIAGSQ